MHSRSWIAVAALALLLLSCQAPSATLNRSSSAAAVPQDVVDAWNEVCVVYNFAPCPIGADDISCTETMGAMYYGSSFEAESTLLMISIQGRLLSSGYVEPDEDDLLSAVINDPAWYR